MHDESIRISHLRKQFSHRKLLESHERDTKQRKTSQCDNQDTDNDEKEDRRRSSQFSQSGTVKLGSWRARARVCYGDDFEQPRKHLDFTSSVLISCWVSSALVEHWVRRPSSRSAEMSIIDCTTSKARRISCSASSLSAIPRATIGPTRGSSPYQEDDSPYLTGIMLVTRSFPIETRRYHHY